MRAFNSSGCAVVRKWRMLLKALLAAPLAYVHGVTPTQAEPPAPPLHFEAGTVVAGGYRLAEAITIAPTNGPVSLSVIGGAPLRWHVEVRNGVTRLLQIDGRWAAQAEYTRRDRDGQPACQIYQTFASPEWLLRGGSHAARPDFAPVDDRIYMFRDTPCP